MNTSELQSILQSEKKYSVAEIQNIIQEMINDVVEELRHLDVTETKSLWYQGEINGFYICRDLLDHLESEE